LSHLKIKKGPTRKAAVQALRGLSEVAQLPELLKQALETNQKLIEENNRLHEEIGKTLEDHESDIENLKEAIKKLVLLPGSAHE